MKKDSKHLSSVNIHNKGSIRIEGDVVGRDKITYSSSSYHSNVEQTLREWEDFVNAKIDNTSLTFDEKKDVKNQVTSIKSAIANDEGKNINRLEKLINTLAIMSPDIFEVVIATLANPLAGVGLTIHKIGDKAKLESKTK